jgi:Aspartyl protease
MVTRWEPFDYSSNTIFVTCLLEGSSEKTEATLIIDTGMNRSDVSPSIAKLLKLSPAGSTTSRSPSGSISQEMVTLGKITFSGVSKSNLTVTSSDLSERSEKAYGRKVDGLLGTDFFADALLTIDFKAHRLSISPMAQLSGKMILDIPLTPFSGLVLAQVTLANNLTMLAIVDTGADDPTDFVFYEDALYGIDFKSTGMSVFHDAAGSNFVRHGTIGPVKIASETFTLPSITLLEKSKENPYGTRYRPALLTNQFLSHFGIQLDFKNSRMKLFQP